MTILVTLNQAWRLLSEAALRMQCAPTQCVADGVCVYVCVHMYVFNPPPVPMALRCGFGTNPL